MDLPDYITIAGFVAVLAFLRNLRRDIAVLRERMAKLEGLLEGYTKRADAISS